MFDAIKELDGQELGFLCDVIMPEKLSNLMLAETHGGGLNLNDMSYDSAFSTLKKIC